MESRKRIAEITHLSSFGMILIVFGHSRPAPKAPEVAGADMLYTIAQIIYTFHIPLFFFISGFLFIYTTINITRFDYFSFIKKKVKRLLLPYFLLSTAAFVIKIPLTSYAWNPMTLSLSSYLESLLYPSKNAIGYFWFLPTLFIIFTLAPLLRESLLTKKKNWYVCCALLLIVFHFSRTLIDIKIVNLSGALYYTIYFWCGMLFFIYRKSVDTRRTMPAFMLCAVLLLLFYFTIETVCFRQFMCSFSGIVMSYYLIKAYTVRGLRWFSFIDGYTYQIYLLSWFPQVFFRVVMYQKLHAGFWGPVVFMFFAGLLLPVCATRFTEKFMPQLSFAIGHKLTR